MAGASCMGEASPPTVVLHWAGDFQKVGGEQFSHLEGEATRPRDREIPHNLQIQGHQSAWIGISAEAGTDSPDCGGPAPRLLPVLTRLPDPQLTVPHEWDHQLRPSHAVLDELLLSEASGHPVCE